MTQALAMAVLDDIRTSLAPVPVELYRPETLRTPFVWIRPPSSSRGSLPGFSPQKSGLLTIDAWHYSLEDVAGIYDALRWLDGYSTGSMTYHEESAVVVPEPDSQHMTVTWSVAYIEGA